eukprot:2230664-Rhodomonas_salina.1
MSVAPNFSTSANCGNHYRAGVPDRRVTRNLFYLSLRSERTEAESIMLTKLMKGLDGFSADGEWIWEPHDADWIYQGGPTGHLHEVYFNQ